MSSSRHVLGKTKIQEIRAGAHELTLGLSDSEATRVLLMAILLELKVLQSR